MVIVIHFPLSVKQYAQADSCPGREINLPNRCPHPDCQASGSLIRWGTYWRWACTESGDYRLCIQRVRCQACRRTHSLLPDFLHPHRHYGLNLLYRVAWLDVIVGLGFGRLIQQLPESGPAPVTIREWVRAFAYGAGHLLLATLTRSLLRLAPQPDPTETTPLHLGRSRQPQQQWLKQTYQFWQVAEQVYAQVKGRQPRLAFSVDQLFPFLLHWLQSQSLPPRLFWSPALVTTPTQPFQGAV
ncbi:MAG: DUF6431 domain-containing protein [Chloroflexota bacterium]